MEDIKKTGKSNDESAKVKTWLDLTEEELELLETNTACMYGRKERDFGRP